MTECPNMLRRARWHHDTIAAVFALAAMAASTTIVPSARSATLPIVPLTRIGADGSGYLADPQPVHLSAPLAGRIQLLSGTTRAVIACAFPLRPGCFDWAAITVDPGALRVPVEQAGSTITTMQNINIFQGVNGKWHAAVELDLQRADFSGHWTVITHARPVDPVPPGTVPTAWTVDTLLSGSLSQPVQGNYDAKYFTDDGHLYLLYVRNHVPEPALRNEIVIQAMQTPTQAKAEAPVVLLAPGDRFGPLNSEQFADTRAKLVEAPWIARIGNKYALIYSTGSYLSAGYKAGVAWSDTLLPAPGQHYRKVLQADPANIWQSLHGIEVRYLLQSEKLRWPNFTLPAVVGPGVASAVETPAGDWQLFFNGYAPDDMTAGPNGAVAPSHRRPYAMRLTVSVPQDKAVSQASDAELAQWMQPAP